MQVCYLNGVFRLLFFFGDLFLKFYRNHGRPKRSHRKKMAFFIYHKYGFHRHFILRVCGESQIWHLTLEDIHYIDLNLTVINAKKFCYLLAFTHAYLQKFYSYFQTDIRFTITDPRILSYTNFIYILLLKIKRML